MIARLKIVPWSEEIDFTESFNRIYISTTFFHWWIRTYNISYVFERGVGGWGGGLAGVELMTRTHIKAYDKFNFYLSLFCGQVTSEYSPPITESLLTARKIQDQGTIMSLLDLLLDKFVNSHVIRLNFPRVGLSSEARSFDIDFSTPEGRSVVEGELT